MERNANDNFGNQNSSDAPSGAGFGSTSGQGSQGTTSGTGEFSGDASGNSDSSFSRDAANETSKLADRAKSAMGTAQDKLADVGSTVRDRAGSIKTSLADALESGAERLRQQGTGGGQLAGAAATGEGSGVIATDDNRLADVSSQVAGGLQASADWLRDADLDGLKSGLERQVKEHPGRTLAVAVGLGYLLGKAIRK